MGAPTFFICPTTDMIKPPQRAARIHRVVVSVLVGILGWGLLGIGGWAQTPLSPGSSLPSVESSLKRPDGSTVAPQSLFGKTGTVVLFWSNQCPWVDRYEKRVKDLVSDVHGDGIQVVRVNSNKGEQVSPAQAEKKSYAAPYVRDPNATLAQALGASRTPEAFVFDQSRTLVYTGAIDDNPSGAEQVDTPYLRKAVEALQAGTEVPEQKTKAFGCVLKQPK